MWVFEPVRSPLEKISGDVGIIITFIDSEAVDTLMAEGKNDDALTASILAIRLAAAFTNEDLIRKLTTRAETLLTDQTAASMELLQSNGHGERDLAGEKLGVEAREQLGRRNIFRAAAA